MSKQDYINQIGQHLSEEGYTEDLTFGNLIIPEDSDYEDFGEGTEEIEVSKAIDFTKSDSAGACWEGYERVPNTKKGDSGSCRKIGSSQAGGDDDMFDNPEGAKKRAMEMGLKGYHTHKDKDGNTIYMPGLTHEEYLKEVKSKASEYQGRKVTLNKPFRTPDGPKKRSVYVKNEKGNVVKVNFGDPNMRIKKNDPARRKSFRARHNCDNPGPKWKARYWSCKAW